MCDVFIPRYVTQDNKYLVENVVIDVHGHFHFMRNCDRVRGGSMLKAKILKEEGYVYQYIPVH